MLQYDKYVTGHPIAIHIGPLECAGFENMEGLIKCRVLAPRVLYHPVLPYRLHNRLMFILCRTCAEEARQEDCNHERVEDRAFVGTYVLDELRLALEMNYTVLECFEVWEYEVTQLDRETGEGGIFPSYVNQFAKIKEHASGLPPHVKTDEEIARYISEFLRHEGIFLEARLILKNPGLRYLAKLLLNSLWGKFGQREDLGQTTIVKTPQALFDLVYNPAVTVKYIEQASEDIFYVSWSHNGDCFTQNPNISPVIAAYTTAQARIRLYRVLVKLGDAILYYDTDSLMIAHAPGLYLPPTGPYLGDLTDEVLAYGPGSKIIAFVSCGPKCYSYIVAIRGDVNNTKVITKVKGFSLNYTNAKAISFDTLKGQVTGSGPAEAVIKEPMKIVTSRDHTLVSADREKKQRLVYTKRRLTDDYGTLPFGFKRPRNY